MAVVRWLVGAALGLGWLAAPAAAIPRLDLSGYPPPAPGDRRWVIQLSGLLPPSPDPSLAGDPADWRVQVVVGRTVVVDCNSKSLGGSVQQVPLEVGGHPQVLLRATGGAVLSTRMACLEESPRRSQFLSLGREPTLLPYRVSWPIVVDAPAELEVRWRLWKAEASLKPAMLQRQR